MKGFRPRETRAVERLPAARRAYDELRRRILHGELPAGCLLNEVDTAEELGVSRTPVREALRELLNDGLIEDGPRRQSVVAAASPELGREVRLMRVALEALAVREATGTGDTLGVDRLRLILIRTQRALAEGDLQAVLDCDDEFHLQIAAMARLPIVADAIRRLRGLTRLIALADDWSLVQLAESAREHDALVDLIEQGDADGAEHALLRHLDPTVVARQR